MAPDGEIEELSSRLDSHHPIDLLRRFVAAGDDRRRDEPAEVAGGDTAEIELNLGLSLGGCFGAGPNDSRLVRSYSITTFPVDRAEFPAATRAPLARTCSLPAEEMGKREEKGGLRMMEAKRKRWEKRTGDSKDPRVESLDDDNNGEVSGRQFVGKENGVVVDAELASWTFPAAGLRPASQGSIGSQGSNSSVVSDLESKPLQGLGNCAEAALDHTPHKASAASPNPLAGKPASLTREGDGPSKKKACTANGANGVREMERSMMEEMPCVSTKGDGPNGRRVEGFLYKYMKGEEVRIVCVCHGSFLTPAEFVKHAGGGDVAHPLRHIVINPTPSAYL